MLLFFELFTTVQEVNIDTVNTYVLEMENSADFLRDSSEFEGGEAKGRRFIVK